MAHPLTSPVVGVAPLARRLAEHEQPVTLLDVRWELASGPRPGDYAAGHIPGAAFVDLDRDLAAPPGPNGRHPLPEADVFERAMRAAGVSGEREVVVYDAATSLAAARAWWLLRYFGHERVTVLDGGLAAWVAGGHGVEDGVPQLAPGDFVARPGGLPIVDAPGAAQLAELGVLIDARAPERFRGETEPIDPVAGHIPGAVNRPAAANIAADGRLLSPEELRTRFASLGVDGEVPVGCYCGSGVAAAHELLALAHAGFAGALYPGSWSEWITDPDRPVATGISS